MMLDAARLHAGIAKINAEMPAISEVLNRADAVLGDGDSGTMLARLIDGLARNDAAGKALPELLGAYARAAMASTGSSLGTLVATALAAAGRSVGERTTLTGGPEIAAVLTAARDAMLKRGGSSLGDKTVIDAIDAIAVAFLSASADQNASTVAAQAAADALARFRERPCRVGRARVFGDKSIGLDDPGMLAASLLTGVLASSSREKAS